MWMWGRGVLRYHGRAINPRARFRDTGTANSPKVAIVNKQFAKKYWPNSDALGKRFRMDNASGPLIQIAVAVTMLAAFIPAPRASRIDPTRALGYE